MKTERGMDFMYWLEVHISEGVRFALPPLVHQIFHFTRLHLIHTHLNMIRVLLGLCVLNRKYDVHLGLDEVLYAYSIKRHKLGRYYLIANASCFNWSQTCPTQARTSFKAMYYCSVLGGMRGTPYFRSFE